MFEGIILFIGFVIWSIISGKKDQKDKAEQQLLQQLGKSKRERLQKIEDEYRHSINAWIGKWNKKIYTDRWIPKGAISEIVTAYPPPALPHTLSTSVSGLDTDAEKKVLQIFFEHNEALKQRKKASLKKFFDTVEKNPLTEEQANACICMDNHVQIVASAGSGKTSTMVAKVGYVLRETLADPDEIIVLAFNRNAADELSERIGDRLAGVNGIDEVRATTFHSFGLSVIGEATEHKPRIAPWIANGDESKTIEDIAGQLRSQDPGFGYQWDYFRAIYGRDIALRLDCDARINEADGEQKQPRYRAVSGDLVRSLEELAIANWLFYHGVVFKYEAPYEIDTSDAEYAAYHPDFFYPEITVYHEHFALDRNGQSHFGTSYVEGVAWKRTLHKENRTTLFETHSHEMVQNGTLVQGPALDRLKEMLEKHGLSPKFDIDRKVPRDQEPISSSDLARLIRTFQQHVKSNGLSMEDVRRSADQQSTTKKSGGLFTGFLDALIPTSSGDDRIQQFLAIYEKIAAEWDRRLREGNYVDYEDMLLLAAECIEDGRYESPYKMILADEFQDSSRARIRLMLALTKANEKTHLCVVGDDWQGINRFAGADITVMTEFDKTFDPATTLNLSRTFRCPKEICETSSSFIQKNPAQLRKHVIPSGYYANAVVSFTSKNEGKLIAHLERRLERMYEQIVAGGIANQYGENISVLLLGRYKKLKPLALRQWQKRFAQMITIEYRTVHSSKGLEADYVVILGLDQGIMGFPSNIQDDALLQIPMPVPDNYLHAEERRLFYVALTRAKRQVWIYGSSSKLSPFVLELNKEGQLPITSLDGDKIEPCPKCEKGVLRDRDGKFGTFKGCNAYPVCTHTQ